MWRAAPLGWCESLRPATDLAFPRPFEPPPPWPVAMASFATETRLSVVAFVCQFTVDHPLGHNCSYPCDGMRAEYAQKGLDGQETPCNHLLKSRPTAEKLSQVQKSRKSSAW